MLLDESIMRRPALMPFSISGEAFSYPLGTGISRVNPSAEAIKLHAN
jgi:hypothetical protein